MGSAFVCVLILTPTHHNLTPNVQPTTIPVGVESEGASAEELADKMRDTVVSRDRGRRNRVLGFAS